MKVKELIEQLSKLNPETEMCIKVEDVSGYIGIIPVEEDSVYIDTPFDSNGFNGFGEESEIEECGVIEIRY